MKLINFNFDLTKFDTYQPVVVFSTNKNSFLILAKLGTKDEKGKDIPQNDKKCIKFRDIFLRIKYLDSDILYNRIMKTNYDYDIRSKKYGVHLCMEISQKPQFYKKTVKTGSIVSLPIGKNNIFQFHLKYNCKTQSYNTTNDGDWPCNDVKFR